MRRLTPGAWGAVLAWFIHPTLAHAVYFAPGGVDVYQSGSLVGHRSTLNFVSGATVSDDAANDKVDITVTGGGGAGSGDVVGPSSARDNTFARFDGVTGKLIQAVPSAGASLSDLGDAVFDGKVWAGSGVIVNPADQVQLRAGAQGTQTVNIVEFYNKSGQLSFSMAADGSVSAPVSGLSQSERFGASSTNLGTQSTVLGNSAAAGTGNSDVAVGYNARMTGGGGSAVAIGASVLSSGLRATAVGAAAQATGSTASAVGFSSVSSGNTSTAVGASSSASGTHSIAIGGSATNAFDFAASIGRSATTTATNQFVFGSASGQFKDFYLGSGVTSTTVASTVTVNGSGGSGADRAGYELAFRGGASTGTGLGGRLSFWTTPAAGGTSSTPNSWSERLRIAGNGDISLESFGSTNVLLYADASKIIKPVALGSGLSFSGGTLSAPGVPAFVTKTGSATLLTSETRVLVNSASATNITLPSAATGTETVIKNIGTGMPTILAAGSDQIEAAASITMTQQYEVVTVHTDGVSKWWIE
jgi:hypothetical protein